MAIKHVGEIVLAWARGHEIVCDACECDNVRVKLIFGRTKGAVLMPEKMAFIKHEGRIHPLAHYRKGKWLANVAEPDDLEDFLAGITILKDGVECPHPFFCSLPGAPLCHICHGKGEE